MQTASGYTLYYTLVPCHYAFAPCLCMHTPVVYSGIMAFTLYIYDAPNKLFKDNNKKVPVTRTVTHVTRVAQSKLTQNSIRGIMSFASLMKIMAMPIHFYFVTCRIDLLKVYCYSQGLCIHL